MSDSVLVIYDGSRIADVYDVPAQCALGDIMDYLELCASRGDKYTYSDDGAILFEKYIPRHSFIIWSKYILVAALHPVSHSIGNAPDSLEETSSKGLQGTITPSEENKEQNTPGESSISASSEEQLRQNTPKESSPNEKQPAPESSVNPDEYSYIWTPENSSDSSSSSSSEEQLRQNTPKESSNVSSSEEQLRQNTPKESSDVSSDEEKQNTLKESSNVSSSEEQLRQNTPKESSSDEERTAPEIAVDPEKYPFLWRYTSEYLY